MQNNNAHHPMVTDLDFAKDITLTNNEILDLTRVTPDSTNIFQTQLYSNRLDASYPDMISPTLLNTR